MSPNSLSRTFFLILTTSFVWSCGPKEAPSETVPSRLLGGEHEPEKAIPRVEYKLSDRDKTPLSPAPKNAYTTGSGLRFVVFKRGDNHEHPLSTTKVKVHYEGSTADDKIFDSSVARKEPISFRLTDVIPGWREGVKLMTIGDTFRFWIPEKDAYRGAPGKPAGILTFTVELLEMEVTKLKLPPLEPSKGEEAGGGGGHSH